MIKNEKEANAIEKVIARIEDSKDKEGYTFKEHLTELINRILQNPKEYPLDKFEDLSYLIKLSRLRIKQPLRDAEVKTLHKTFSEKQEWVSRFESQFADVRNYKIYSL